MVVAFPFHAGSPSTGTSISRRTLRHRPLVAPAPLPARGLLPRSLHRQNRQVVRQLPAREREHLVDDRPHRPLGITAALVREQIEQALLAEQLVAASRFRQAVGVQEQQVSRLDRVRRQLELLMRERPDERGVAPQLANAAVRADARPGRVAGVAVLEEARPRSPARRRRQSRRSPSASCRTAAGSPSTITSFGFLSCCVACTRMAFFTSDVSTAASTPCPEMSPTVMPSLSCSSSNRS